MLGLRDYVVHMSDAKINLTIKLDKETHTRYKLYAVRNDKTFKDIFVERMEELLEKEEKENRGSE